MLLVFKLLVTPTLIGCVSLVGRRWGPAVSGWLVGLPLTSAPVAVFLALDQGNIFASRAAQGTLLGQVSQSSFCLVYSWLLFRTGWLTSLLVSCCVFLASTLALEQLSVPLPLAFVGVVVFLVVVLKLLPGSLIQISSSDLPAISPQWETSLRMLMATAFVLVLTGVASSLGPRLSGLLTPFPIYATILAAFTHHFQGPTAACRLLRGVVIGLFTPAVFFLIVAGMVEQWGIVATFSVATIVALFTHACLLFILRRV